uniref:Trace amine-associated receptor 1 n=1 Tax=Cyanistes caeruleus TaxID=156563 RepID=A0A8C0UMD2_CYACU
MRTRIFLMQLGCESVNGSCIRSSWSNSIRISMYIFMACIILATVVGNLTVIISISHFKQLHTPTNFLILSMATVDFLLGFFIMPCSMVRSVEHCWYFGEFFCKIHTSMDIMLSTASIFHLSFISIDRYYAVCDPLRYKSKINTFVIVVMVCISWMVPAAFGQKRFMIMYSVAKKQARSIDAISRKKMQFEMKQHISFCRERKAAKTLGIIMGVFLICWTPFFFFTATNPFMNYVIPPVLIDALVWFGYLNSTFNPIVYAFFYMWFRRALKIILFGKVFQQDSSRTHLFSD